MKILMMSGRICLRKGENVNHASFDGVEKKSHVCHHQKGGECECILMMSKEESNKAHFASRLIKQGSFCFKINTRLFQQTKP